MAWLTLFVVCSLLLLATPNPAGAEVTGCDEKQCPFYRFMKYYKELGCIPSNTSECCPSQYDCNPFTTLDKKKCHYKGIEYDVGANLQDEIDQICTPTCRCTNHTASGEATFSCAHYDCPEFFDPKGLAPGCYRKYSVNQCCSTGISCEQASGSEDLRNEPVTRCSYGGKNYSEGQYIDIPDSQCISCVCQEGFDGTLNGPWCRKLTCDVMLSHSKQDLSNCAPVYYGSHRCCPIELHCSSSGNEAVLPSTETRLANDGQCTFGQQRLNRGDELPMSNPCIKCKCDLPPLVTCIQIPHSECTSSNS